MATRSRAIPRPSNAEGPDAQYAFVAGLYAAALLVPIVVLALSHLVGGAATLYVGFLAAVAGVTAVAGRAASRTPGLAIRLGRRDAVWLLVALPFAWFGGALGAASAVGVELPVVAIPLAAFGTAGGMLLAVVLVPMSRTRYADAVLEGATDLAEWEARWPRRWRRVAGGVSVGAFAAGTVGIVAVFAFGVERAWGLYYLVFVGVPFMNLLNPRTFRVTDAGLVIERPLQRQFRSWSAFTGYELTEDALVIRSAAWWRPAHRCDRTDIADVDAAVGALDGILASRSG